MVRWDLVHARPFRDLLGTPVSRRQSYPAFLPVDHNKTIMNRSNLLGMVIGRSTYYEYTEGQLGWDSKKIT